MRAHCQSVFRNESVFVHAQVTSDGAYKTAIEHASRQVFPLLIFEGVEKPRANARGHADLIERHAAHFALAPQMFAKASFAHR